jgi:preprotein translocase subunit SecA
LTEALAIIKRAIVLDSNNIGENHELRPVQLLSVLIMLKAKNGRLAQIATGEGKATIISVLAAIKALQGNKVDIITNSLILAKRDAKEKETFFNMFNIKVAHNSDDNYNFKDKKKCYDSSIDIIYGDASGFQFDILRHEYSDLGTRGDRSFKNTIAIIDEVDSMLIDDSSKIAMLADTMPGMSSLSILLTSIWQELHRIISRFQKKDGNLLYNKPLQSKDLNNKQDSNFEQTIAKIKNYIEFIRK